MPLIYSYSYLHCLIYTYLSILIYALFILLYEFDKIDKIWEIYIEITMKLSRLKSASSIDDDYLEAATGGVLKILQYLEENTCIRVSF